MNMQLGFTVVLFTLLVHAAAGSNVCSCTCPSKHQGATFTVKNCDDCGSRCKSTYPNCGDRKISHQCVPVEDDDMLYHHEQQKQTSLPIDTATSDSEESGEVDMSSRFERHSTHN
eukprot:gb/GECG01001922.1/.p1 GENE.gb/GECG01001922.1/~~gb/GECG01001922.1/.p1  ORF type:complete len:115 (+),score=6.93 gb/GECG01001922.1/:1-345(+)